MLTPLVVAAHVPRSAQDHQLDDAAIWSDSSRWKDGAEECVRRLLRRAGRSDEEIARLTAVHGEGSIFPYVSVIDTQPGEGNRRKRIPMDSFVGARVTSNPWEIAVSPDGRAALTRVRVRERWERADLLDVSLRTGRTHQIRVHLAHIGHPVVGDAVYGSGWERGMGGPSRSWAMELSRRTPRLFLHAAELAFDHPVDGRPMRFHAPLANDLSDVATWARGSE